MWDPVDQKTIIATAQDKGYKYHYIPSVVNLPNGCDFTNPTIKQYSEYFVYCLVNQQVPGPINTQTVVQPFPYPMNYSCAEVAVGLSLIPTGIYRSICCERGEKIKKKRIKMHRINCFF